MRGFGRGPSPSGFLQLVEHLLGLVRRTGVLAVSQVPFLSNPLSRGKINGWLEMCFPSNLYLHRKVCCS